MKKSSVALFLLGIIFVLPAPTPYGAGPSFAQKESSIKMKDMPDDHWAASAVYDLIKMGVTKGYPDGTFRGNKTISRFEVAIFLSKLAKAIDATDLRADIKSLKNQIVDLKKKGGLGFSGNYSTLWRGGGLLVGRNGGRGTVGSYRVNLSSFSDLGEGSSIKVNLDTTDYGYNTATAGGVLASQLLAIESTLKLDLSGLELGFDKMIDLKLTYGPGPQQHADPTGLLPSETGIIFDRPYTGVSAATHFWGAEVSGGYLARELSSSGKVNVSELTGTIGYNLSGVPLFRNLKVSIGGDYIAQGLISQANRDLRAKITISAPFGDKVQTSAAVGMASSNTRGMMVSGVLDVKEVGSSGLAAMIRVSRIGSQYIPDVFQNALLTEAGLDVFNRPLAEGTYDIGSVITQNLADKVKLVAKGDIRLSGELKYADSTVGRFTAQGGVLYEIAPNTQLDAAYRVHQDKAANTTTDAALLGLLYHF